MILSMKWKCLDCSRNQRMVKGKQRQGAASLMVVVLGVMVVIFVLAMAYFFRLRETTSQLARFLNGEIAGFLAEGAMNEAFSYIRKEANKEGSPWFSEFRKSLLSGPISPAEEKFLPDKMISLAENIYQVSPNIEVVIRFEDISPFPEDPAPQPSEKMGVLRITSTAVYKNIKKTVCTLRDVKVVNVDIPDPVSKYKFYLLELGCLTFNAETKPRNITPLPSAEKNLIETRWKFKWGEENIDNYPLCKRKTAYFFWNLPDFNLFTFRSEASSRKLFHQLNGMALLDEKTDFKDSEFQGMGGILTRHPMNLDKVTIPTSSQISFTVLGKKEMHIRNHRDLFLNACLNIPDGDIFLERGTSVRGRVFGRKAHLEDMNGRLEYNRSSASPVYQVEISGQINLWKTL